MRTKIYRMPVHSDQEDHVQNKTYITVDEKGYVFFEDSDMLIEEDWTDKVLKWPANLLVLIDDTFQDKDGNCREFTDDQMDGLIYVLDGLFEEDRVLIYNFFLGELTIDQNTEYSGMSVREVMQNVNRIIFQIRTPENIPLYRDGLAATYGDMDIHLVE